jgi:hypothetical protein
MRALTRAVGLVLLAMAPAASQTRGATITGVVLDSAARPIFGADVLLRPSNKRTTTDSAGKFIITGLDDGGYTVAARKLGYAPDRWDVKLSKNGKIDLKLVLGRALKLDTVIVTAAADCPEYSLDGFACRRRFGGGLFLDYPDIDEHRARYTADIFKDIPGFRVQLMRTRFGPEPVPVLANGFGCISSLVNGREVTPANSIPKNPLDLSAMEVYLKPDSVPRAYQRYTWPSRDLHRFGRCAVVVYWTIWAAPEAR